MEIPESIRSRLNALKIDKHPKSICIANYKGGVGKTTVTTLLGYFLASKGNRVLLFDIDPQCSLSLAIMKGARLRLLLTIAYRIYFKEEIISV